MFWPQRIYSTRALGLFKWATSKKMKQAEFLLYDSVRPHEPKNPKTLKKYHEAFFFTAEIQNGRRSYILKKMKNARMINDTTFLTFLGSRNPMNMIFLRSEVKVTF